MPPARLARLAAALDTGTTMSRQNVELARRGYEALNQGGLERIEEFLDPGIEWEISSVAPNAGSYRGLGPVRC